MASVGIQGGQGRTLVYIPISASTGTQTLVAAPTGDRRIKVVSYVIVGFANCTCKFTDNTGDLTGAMDIAQYGGVVAAGQPSVPWFVTHINEPLKIVSTAAVNGHLAYIVET